MDPTEAMEAIEPAEMSEAIDPAEETDAMQPAEVSEAMDPAEATEPMEPADAQDAIDPAEAFNVQSSASECVVGFEEFGVRMGTIFHAPPPTRRLPDIPLAVLAQLQRHVHVFRRGAGMRVQVRDAPGDAQHILAISHNIYHKHFHNYPQILPAITSTPRHPPTPQLITQSPQLIQHSHHYPHITHNTTFTT